MDQNNNNNQPALSPDSMEQIKLAAKALHEASHILIGAAAGMSAESGIDYTDEISFAEKYPGLKQRYGVRKRYDLMGFREWKPEESFAYLAQHVKEMLTVKDEAEYGFLRSIVGEKDHFVITTNVDDLFYRSGFESQNIYTPQGSFSRFQCLKPCSQETWSSMPIVEKLLPKIDLSNVIMPPEDVPHCPKCNGPIFGNVRGGGWFIHQPYEEAETRYHQWLEKVSSSGDPLTLIEIGVGFNTPTWIRFPFERFAQYWKNTKLIRVNLHYPEIHQQNLVSEGKAFAVQLSARQGLKLILEELQRLREAEKKKD